MRQPEGFEDNRKPNQVCLLKRALYGLKQSPRQWCKCFDEFMLKSGFEISNFDSYVYVKKRPEMSKVYQLLYVDDMLLANRGRLEIKQLKTQLRERFEMKDLGSAKRILRMEITKNKEMRILFLSLKDYISKVLDRFGMSDAKLVSTPIAQHFKLTTISIEEEEKEFKHMELVLYLSAMGVLCMLCYVAGLI